MGNQWCIRLISFLPLSGDWLVISESYRLQALKTSGSTCIYLIKFGFSLGTLNFLSSSRNWKILRTPSIMIRPQGDAMN
jgi:hypothetical protein